MASRKKIEKGAPSRKKKILTKQAKPTVLKRDIRERRRETMPDVTNVQTLTDQIEAMKKALKATGKNVAVARFTPEPFFVLYTFTVSRPLTGYLVQFRDRWNAADFNAIKILIDGKWDGDNSDCFLSKGSTIAFTKVVVSKHQIAECKGLVYLNQKWVKQVWEALFGGLTVTPLLIAQTTQKRQTNAHRKGFDATAKRKLATAFLVNHWRIGNASPKRQDGDIGRLGFGNSKRGNFHNMLKRAGFKSDFTSPKIGVEPFKNEESLPLKFSKLLKLIATDFENQSR